MTGGLTPAPRPLLVAPDMGYGHLRAAHSLGEALGVEPRRADAPPLADPDEVRTWDRVRSVYEALSRLSQLGAWSRPALWLLDGITNIPPLLPLRDLSRPSRFTRLLEHFATQGFGRGLLRRLEAHGEVLVTTFYASAVLADRVGYDRIHCVVTDVDANRVWAPLRPATTRIRYHVATQRARRRLECYGVPPERIGVTGFPLPPSLAGDGTGGPLGGRVAARMRRLDPRGAFARRAPAGAKALLARAPEDAANGPVRVVFAVGGAGAQTGMARHVLEGLRPLLRARAARLSLVAGVRREVAERFRTWCRPEEEGVEVLWEEDFASAYRTLNARLAASHLLWTKPSELVFYAGLGLPLALAPPVGAQERSNRRWVLGRGAALEPPHPRRAGAWLQEMLDGGHLAEAAWRGFAGIPHDGARRIRDAVTSAGAPVGREEEVVA